MKTLARLLTMLALVTATFAAHADDFDDTLKLFRNSHQSLSYFRTSYGYALFPTIGEGGFIVAGGHGTGKVYVKDRYVGDTSMTQVSIGAQAGGQAYSQIVFFRNRAAFLRFTAGNYEFAADASAVAITASADATAGTKGASASTGINKNQAGTMGGYHDGMAVFSIVKGGAMLQAAIGGQKFSYTPRAR